jgi:hypothetical protein
MVGTRRTPIGRSPTPRVTPHAIDLFEEIMRHRYRRDWLDVTRGLRTELNDELGMAPFNPDVLLHCDGETPPDRDWPLGQEDWFRSRRLRVELETALRARREARRGAPAPTAPPPNQPPQ